MAGEEKRLVCGPGAPCDKHRLQQRLAVVRFEAAHAPHIAAARRQGARAKDTVDDALHVRLELREVEPTPETHG